MLVMVRIITNFDHHQILCYKERINTLLFWKKRITADETTLKAVGGFYPR